MAQQHRRPVLDYTSRDWEAILADSIRRINFYTPQWTDHAPTDFGIVLLELFAHSADTLHFYIDRTAQEGFLPTAITRRSIINHLKLIDYRLAGPTASYVDVKLTIAADPLADVTVPAGTLLQSTATETKEAVSFETAEDVLFDQSEIPSYPHTETVGARQGKTAEEVVGLSNGNPFQSFSLSGIPIIEDSLQIFLDEGAGPELWTLVTNFTQSNPTDKVYYIEIDENDVVTIFFGDNIQGRIPKNAAEISATYRLGGGTVGNVGSGTIVRVVDTILNDLGDPITVTCTNDSPATGGEDHESIEHSRKYGPLSLRALNRAVTIEDYKTLAEAYPGVASARVELGDVTSGCCCGIRIYIVPEGGGLAPQSLKDALLLYFDDRKMVGTCVEIGDPERFVNFDCMGTVYVGTDYDQESVEARIDADVASFFALDSGNVGFGADIYLSDVFNLLDSVEGVDHVDLTELTCRPEPETIDSGVKFDNMDAAERKILVKTPAICEDWRIVFGTETIFTVYTIGPPLVDKGSGEVGTTFSCDEVEFKIIPGDVPVTPGAVVTFHTCEKLANVPISDSNYSQLGATIFTYTGGTRSGEPCG